MIYLPVSLFLFVLLILLLPFIWFVFTVDVVQVAAAKLGFSPEIGLLLLLLILLGSTVNIPLYRVETQSDPLDEFMQLFQRQFWGIPLVQMRQVVVVALNLGGGLIPVLLALYQFSQANPLSILLVTAIVTVVSYFAAHVVPGIGIQMNPLLAPLTAAATALVFAAGQAPSVAFAGGVLGTLIGADLLHLKDITAMASGVLSIGGAGVFDGLALCGLFALLLT
ncbi:hypothetical protein XM38_022960 [Halomicronema hongdechloris C2206]|uniref:DUF1614 domain-containing protein n=1 Tax=Halomicronema hongdechloris C2206 TaxID=1641165 RepID=A0A1Z3HM17_9CYAN|nr:DUF1614 domain-containing protein [Halomicronema hongdechloris]ASC71344.1 hypothetical protein XM38_022960 [Halomicronema hongdechloris C2206]